jgi:hypothetical protein
MTWLEGTASGSAHWLRQAKTRALEPLCSAAKLRLIRTRGRGAACSYPSLPAGLAAVVTPKSAQSTLNPDKVAAVAKPVARAARCHVTRRRRRRRYNARYNVSAASAL